MSKFKKVYVGEVGVDSGQIMICDPCYIGSEWKEKGMVDFRVYKHKKTGKVYEFVYKGERKKIKGSTVFKSYDDTVYMGKSINDMNENKELEEVKKPKELSLEGDFSYGGCCEATLSKNGFGQLNYRLGHAGAGIASRTFDGDGCYPVYAKVDEDGSVRELTIKFD